MTDSDLFQRSDRVVMPFPNEGKAFCDRELLDRLDHTDGSGLVARDRDMPFQQPRGRMARCALIVAMMDRSQVFSMAERIDQRLRELEPGRYAVL